MDSVVDPQQRSRRDYLSTEGLHAQAHLRMSSVCLCPFFWLTDVGQEHVLRISPLCRRQFAPRTPLFLSVALCLSICGPSRVLPTSSQPATTICHIHQILTHPTHECRRSPASARRISVCQTPYVSMPPFTYDRTQHEITVTVMLVPRTPDVQHRTRTVSSRLLPLSRSPSPYVAPDLSDKDFLEDFSPEVSPLRSVF